MKRTHSILLAGVLALCASLAAVTGAGAAPLVELKIEAKGADVLTQELQLRAECDSACTLGLASVNVLRFSRDGEQLPGAATQPLKGSKRLSAKRAVTFDVPLSTWNRSHLQSAVAAGGYAVVQVAVTVDGGEGPYTTASVRAPSTPKKFLAQEEIVVDLQPQVPAAAPRYRISVSGLQTTDWSYNRDKTTGTCTVISNGAGKQTIRFASTKSAIARIAAVGGEAVLVPASGRAPFVLPMDLKAERDGKVNAGVSGECNGVPAGEEGDGTLEPCRRTGTLTDAKAQLMFSGRDRLNLTVDPSSVAILAPLAHMPNCPIEPFAEADDNLDLMDAVHRLAAPGAAGKVILIAKRSKTDKLEGGATKTTVRWTVTLTKIGR